MGYMLPYRSNQADHARALMTRKESIEAEIEAQHQILRANGSTLTTPLVDVEGFPRADIDVWAVRHARVRIIELRNDYTAIMDEISLALQGVYGPNVTADLDPEPHDSPMATSESLDPSETPEPFARVDGVAPGSPADLAGLKREDLIVSFGRLVVSSFPSSSLQSLADLVASRENLEIDVKILRANEELRTLKLIPRRGWGGRGLLGCHMVPYSP